MQLVESREIRAAPDRVWQALVNPDVLKDCIPGCESMTGSVADGFDVVVAQKIVLMKVRFAGTITLSDVVEGRSVTIMGEGKGGAAGFAKGVAKVTLDPVPEGTLLTYDVEAHVSGKVAGLGRSIIGGVARKLADVFFARLQTAVEPPTGREGAQTGLPDQS